MNLFRPLLPAAIVFLTLLRVQANDEPARREWTVDGGTREALVYVPPTAKTTATPVIFMFHGHGGMMASVAVSYTHLTLPTILRV